MRHSPQVRHAFVFLLYALVVWVLLLLFAACLAPQETSWLPATLWKYFPRPTPYAARVVGAATVALLRAMRAVCRLGRKKCEGSGVSCRDCALCAERPPGCHSANSAIGSVAFTEDRAVQPDRPRAGPTAETAAPALITATVQPLAENFIMRASKLKSRTMSSFTSS